MEIKLPTERAYYPVSPDEPDFLLCWFPGEELAELYSRGLLKKETLEDYPDGLEIEVTTAAFAEAGLKLALDPDGLHRAYEFMREMEILPESGLVFAASLEKTASALQESSHGSAGPFRMGGRTLGLERVPEIREPRMSAGAEPDEVFRRLMEGGRVDLL